jgi:hypothetical protein
MYNSYCVSEDDFAIIRTQQYQALINMLEKIKNLESAAFGGV